VEGGEGEGEGGTPDENGNLFHNLKTPDPARKYDDLERKERQGEILCDLRFFAFLMASTDAPSAAWNSPKFHMFSECGPGVMNLLELRFRAATIACGACTFFQQTRGGSGGLAPGFHEF
jgi:hypothetical protein